jgi:hypothetical protein
MTLLKKTPTKRPKDRDTLMALMSDHLPLIAPQVAIFFPGTSSVLSKHSRKRPHSIHAPWRRCDSLTSSREVVNNPCCGPTRVSATTK